MPTLKYVNHLGETLEFNGKNFFTNSYVLRDYAWNYDNEFNKIKNLNTSGLTSKTLQVSIHASGKDEAYRLFNFFFEIFEKDVLAKTPGKFYIGNYYFSCYVISSAKKSFESAQNLLNLDLTVLSDTNKWVRETSYDFSKNQIISGHGYAYRYPYRYSSGTIKTFANEALNDSNFKLIIYGSCSNPGVYIGDHLYSMDILIEKNERVEIDSREKSILKIQSDGTKVSVLNFRNRTSYIFKRIPTGVIPVSWNNDFGFDITVYDERSEPAWI